MRRPEDPPLWPVFLVLALVATLALLAAMLLLGEPAASRNPSVFGVIFADLRHPAK